MERGAPPGRDMALSLQAVSVPQNDELACSRRWHRHGEVSVAPLAATAKPPMERPMDRSIGGFARKNHAFTFTFTLNCHWVRQKYLKSFISPRGALRRAIRLGCEETCLCTCCMY